MRVTSFDFLKLLITLTLFALIQSRPNTKKSRYTHCFASESITGIYGLGKSWPQTDLDPLSHMRLFSLIIYASSSPSTVHLIMM